MVELVKKLVGVLKLKELFFESFEAQRLVSVDVPREVAVDLNYSAVARRRGARGFDAIATFIATVSGLDSSEVAKITSKIRVVYIIPECQETKDIEITDELLAAIAETQGIYTAHPYFREYLQGACGRLSLPPLIAPPIMGKTLFNRVRDREAKKAQTKLDPKATNVVPLKPSKVG